MIFRRLSKEEHILTRPLYEECFFEDAPQFVDYYYRWKAADNEIWAAIEEKSGRIVSMLHVNPVCVMIGHTEVIIPYLVAIATAGTYRRQGLMRRLMNLALEECRKEKIPFTFLMPASERYYTSFGFLRAWKWMWEEDVCLGGQLPADAIRKMAACCSDDELAALAEHVNAALAERCDMYAKRSVSYYRDLQAQQDASEGCLEVLFSKEGNPLCAVCTAKEDFPAFMILVTDQETYARQMGRKMDTDMLSPEQFAHVMISEVV